MRTLRGVRCVVDPIRLFIKDIWTSRVVQSPIKLDRLTVSRLMRVLGPLGPSRGADLSNDGFLTMTQDNFAHIDEPIE